MIVDASVAFKWIFAEEGSEAAAALIGRDDLEAPRFLLAEIGNALWKKGRRGELGDHASYAAQLAIVASLVILIDDTDVMRRSLEMALRLDHPVYDCIYLALAESRKTVLVSADRHFIDKAARGGFGELVEVLT